MFILISCGYLAVCLVALSIASASAALVTKSLLGRSAVKLDAQLLHVVLLASHLMSSLHWTLLYYRLLLDEFGQSVLLRLSRWQLLRLLLQRAHVEPGCACRPRSPYPSRTLSCPRTRSRYRARRDSTASWSCSRAISSTPTCLSCAARSGNRSCSFSFSTGMSWGANILSRTSDRSAGSHWICRYCLSEVLALPTGIGAVKTN